MRKRISDMTPADKAAFLESVKRSMVLEHGVKWEEMEPGFPEYSTMHAGI